MRAIPKNLPVCTCGNRKFRAVEAGKSRTGKRHFTVACLTCGKPQDVSKTAFALCQYLTNNEPSQAFLQLYHLES